MTDVTKFISGCMASLSAMVQLELPHVNVLSKMDLVPNKRDIEKLVLLIYGRFPSYICILRLFGILILLFVTYLLNPSFRYSL